MFSVIYVYRVPRPNVDAFLRIQRAAAALYRHYGALDDTTYAPADLDARYGCLSFPLALAAHADEAIFVGFSHFHDRLHYETVMQEADADEQIGALHRELVALVELRHVVRGEFERVV